MNEIETNKQKPYKELIKQKASYLKKLKSVKSECKGGDNNKHYGNPGNHRRLL
jgi:hypothetical protein